MKLIKGLVVLIIFAVLGYFGYKYFIGEKNPAQDIYVVQSTDKYNYKLHNNSSEAFKKYFKELYNVLKEENYDEEHYASLIAKLFIIDFYTLDNKISNIDIGGIQFVHSEIVDNFKIKAKDTVYKYVKSNMYGDRKQDLPVVDDVNIDNITVKPLKNNAFNDDKAYYIELSWNYKKDLGFDTKKNIILVHENEKLSLVSID